MRRVVQAFVVTLASLAMVPWSTEADDPEYLLPDIQTVVPRHLQVVNAHQRDILRFSNGIANTGEGPLAVRPDPEPGEATTETTAIQELRDSNHFYACGEEPKQVEECHTVVEEKAVGTFVFHPEHPHWHIGDVALFEIRAGSPDGPLVLDALKTSFCLIDIYRLEGNSPTTKRLFWDCVASYQGIAPGWVDQYHQSTDGQQVDITDLPDGDDYYLVSTSNPDGLMLESDYGNNSAWVKFRLYQQGNGNRKIEVLESSPCGSPGVCGEAKPNRG